jgi:surface protein
MTTTLRVNGGSLKTTNIGASTRIPWSKPSDWPDLPTITSTDNKFVALHAVFPNQDNFATIQVSTSTGTYNVDWGDGVVDTVASGTVAYHNYDYTDPDITVVCSRGYKIATVVVTLNTGGATIFTFSLNNKHNQTALVNGYSSGWLDYSFSSTGLGGTNLNLRTSNSTVAHRLLERVRLYNITNYTGTNGLLADCTNLQSVTMPANTSHLTAAQSFFLNCTQLISVPLFDTSNCTRVDSMFSGCSALQSIPAFNFSKVNNMQSTFSGCISLQFLPFLNTSNVSNMATTFNNCISLKTIPLFNTANVSSMAGTFQDCINLQSVPLLNTRNVTTMASMFKTSWGGNALTTVPLFDTANVTTMASMFEKTYNITTVPLFNTAKVTDMQYMFSNDYQSVSQLQSVPNFNTANVTNMTFMFRYNQNMLSAPEFNTANVTNMDSMFLWCTGLRTIPTYNTSKVRTMNNMLAGCTALQSVPVLDTSNCQIFTAMFSTSPALSAIPAINVSNTVASANYTSIFLSSPSIANVSATGFKYSFSVASCRMSNTALNFMFSNLPTVAGQTVTITSNYGANTCNTTIATSKGWTVTN